MPKLGYKPVKLAAGDSIVTDGSGLYEAGKTVEITAAEKPVGPTTGDDGNNTPLVAAALLSAVAVAGLLYSRKKKKSL